VLNVATTVATEGNSFYGLAIGAGLFYLQGWLPGAAETVPAQGAAFILERRGAGWPQRASRE
jgi:hypothetical protein